METKPGIEIDDFIKTELASLWFPCAVCSFTWGEHSMGQLRDCFQQFGRIKAQRDALLVAAEKALKWFEQKYEDSTWVRRKDLVAELSQRKT